MAFRIAHLGLLLSTWALSACQTPPAPTAVPSISPEEVGEFRKGSGYLNGYLPRTQLPDSLALLPPPPAAGSAQEAADIAHYRQSRAQQGSPRWTLARQDVNLKFPAAAGIFSCALGVSISAEKTPHLNMLLRRTLIDAGLSTYKAKDHHNRKRPYIELAEPTCQPAEEASLSKDGSYPSGHAALGWAWAQILASLAPDRADALLQRGYAFGQSRMVCGYHWQSDVDQGRLIGSAAVARLQSDSVFSAQAQLARLEITAARTQGLQPQASDCAAEALALKP
jgi:acid phosphatase (class A)